MPEGVGLKSSRSSDHTQLQQQNLLIPSRLTIILDCYQKVDLKRAQ